MIRKILIVVLLLPALMACRTLKERQTVEAMEMPPKPAGTARIVLYRIDEATGSRAPVPVIAINGETVGDMDDETLFIRDVTPGAQEVALTLHDGDRRDGMVIEPPVLRAELNAGGEWYIETVVKEPCKTGTRPVNLMSVPTGTWQGDAVLSGLSLVSAALAYATMECGAIYQLSPTWPQSTWNINPLLAQNGAKPVEPVQDRALERSGLSWRATEQVIREHFFSRIDDYKPKLSGDGPDNLLLKTINLVAEEAGSSDVIAIVTVNIGFLQIDEATIAGRHAQKRLRYSLRRDGTALAVVEWTPEGP